MAQFSRIAGARRVRSEVLLSYVHMGAKTVPTRYRTPAHGPVAANKMIFIYSMISIFMNEGFKRLKIYLNHNSADIWTPLVVAFHVEKLI